MQACELCEKPGGERVWSDARLRVVQVDDPGYPGFLRVIWNDHVREMTDLEPAARSHLLDVVLAVEEAQRGLLAPDKVNLASLGTLTPHIHWHVIPRFRGDPQFPDPVWAPTRGGQPRALPMPAADYRAALAGALSRRWPA
ncbi:MAG: HIT family protein [Pseudomonadota bacterium]|jgi:diadenosine tetraphosphate (Ap4A) HIT family hydrolase